MRQRDLVAKSLRIPHQQPCCRVWLQHLRCQLDTTGYDGTAYLQKDNIYVNGLYTFGQPRVGDVDFATQFNLRYKQRTFRIVNNNDVVTRVPMRTMGFSHVGTHFYFDHDGKLYDDSKLSWWFKFTDRIQGRLEDFGQLGLDGINDHSMETYFELTRRTHEKVLA